MATALSKHMSLAEFLVWDDGTDRRYELVDGRVLAMAPPPPVRIGDRDEPGPADW